MSFVDDVIVKKPYACPVCFEAFAKWGPCLNHLNSNASCRAAIDDETFRIQEILRDESQKPTRYIQIYKENLVLHCRQRGWTFPKILNRQEAFLKPEETDMLRQTC
eukprot:s3_g51.t1